MQVKDAIVVVTGASSGIGRATARAFAAKGSHVVVAARSAEALADIEKECGALGAAVLAVPTDTSDAAAVDELARQAVERFGRIDVWVNDAAVTLFGAFTEVPLEDIRRVLDVNVMGYVHGARAALRQMRQQGRGVLVNVSSIAGVVAQPYTSAYTMSKFAVRALGTSLRQELALDGVRGVKVCTVLPAAIDTPLFAHAANYSGRRALALPPVYPPERVARAIVDLVRLPRREVVVGSAGRGLVFQARFAPRLSEKTMAIMVDRLHLSRREQAPTTTGNLYEPVTSPEPATGGWHGRQRTAARRVATLLLAAAAGAAALGPRRKSAAALREERRRG